MRGSIDYTMSTRRSEISDGKKVDYRALNNLYSVDFNAISKREKKKTSLTKVYTVERLISRRKIREESSKHEYLFWKYGNTWAFSYIEQQYNGRNCEAAQL